MQLSDLESLAKKCIDILQSAQDRCLYNYCGQIALESLASRKTRFDLIETFKF